MSQWVERISGHALWPLLVSVEASVDNALAREPVSAEAVDSIERLRTILKFLRARLSASDPILTSPAALEPVVTSITNLQQQLETFVSNGETAHLNKANVHGDTALTQVAQIPTISSPNELTSLIEAHSAYRTTLNRHLKNALSVQQQLSEKNSANEAKIVSIEASLAVEQQRATTLITEQQSQFSAAQDKRASDFAATQADFLAKFTNAITEHQTQFSGDQDARRTAYSQFERKSQEEFATLLGQYSDQLKAHDAAYAETEKQAAEAHKTKLEVLDKKYQDSAQGILVEIRRHKEEVEGLVGVIGNLGVTSGYKKVADQARIMLYVWQALTVISLSLLIAIAMAIAFPDVWGESRKINTAALETTETPAISNIGGQGDLKKVAEPSAASGTDSVKSTPKKPPEPSVSVSSSTKSESDFYHGLITRIFLSLTFGIFAAYAASQASHFLAIEQRNRKLALELEALGPFIEPLEKDERNKFRVQVGERSFGVPDQNDSKQKGNDPVTIMDVLKTTDIKDLMKTIKEALK